MCLSTAAKLKGQSKQISRCTPQTNRRNQNTPGVFHRPHRPSYCSSLQTLCPSIFWRSSAAGSQRSSVRESLCLSSWQTGRSSCSWCWWTEGWGERWSCLPFLQLSPEKKQETKSMNSPEVPNGSPWSALKKGHGTRMSYRNHACFIEANSDSSTLFQPNQTANQAGAHTRS